MQLGRDPASTLEALLLDVLAKEVVYSGVEDAAYVTARLWKRLRSFDLTRPPGVPPIPEPSVDWVADALSSRFADQPEF